MCVLAHNGPLRLNRAIVRTGGIAVRPGPNPDSFSIALNKTKLLGNVFGTLALTLPARWLAIVQLSSLRFRFCCELVENQTIAYDTRYG
jgi:hypothetical protein